MEAASEDFLMFNDVAAEAEHCWQWGGKMRYFSIHAAVRREGKGRKSISHLFHHPRKKVEVSKWVKARDIYISHSRQKRLRMIDRRFGENVLHTESESNPLNKQFPKCRLYRQQHWAFITNIESKSCVLRCWLEKKTSTRQKFRVACIWNWSWLWLRLTSANSWWWW